MRERGLPLSPMMARATVRAVSPKTMTRRLVRPVKFVSDFGRLVGRKDGAWLYGSPAALGFSDRGDVWSVILDGDILERICTAEAYGWGAGAGSPYGVPGDRLYGREAYRTLAKYDALPPRDVPTTAPIWYEADGKAPPEFGRYRHGRFMVRWMARIVREVTSVAVERLSSISEADAMREGIEREDGVVVGAECHGGHHHEITDTRYFIPGLYEEQEQPALDEVPGFSYATSAFFRLWEILHGPGSVEADPWLWVIGFGHIPAP